MKEKYESLLLIIVLLDKSDVITMSSPVSGEDGNDIFDDRFV